MHISDGVLPTGVSIGCYVGAALVAAWSARGAKSDELPKVAVVTSAFFVASLIHIPAGPTSVHLLLPGLVGILLGRCAFVSVLLGIALQSLLFQFGGITAIGANALMMGIPALVSGWIYRLLAGRSVASCAVAGTVAGGFGVVLAAVFLAVLLSTGGEDFWGVAKLALVAHVPVVFIEAAVSAFAVVFLFKVKPELLSASPGGVAAGSRAHG